MTYRPICAPSPGAIRVHPWRFRPGDDVYVCTWMRDEPFKVLGGYLHKDFPHYELLAPDGTVWEMPQLHLLEHARHLKER